MGKVAVVVVFDFDRTLIDGDSDNWVVTEMGLTQLFHQLHRTMPWTSLMNRMMWELHAQGKSVEDIAGCLKRVPLHPLVITSIRAAHSYGCELKIISDANRFFIETILRHHGLLDCFSEIVTNPAFEDGEGRLNIAPFHDSSDSASHGCSLCPPNLCKGLVLDQFQASDLEDGNTRYIYLGDGKGDYCPCLKLRTQDFVMARKGFPLCDRIWSDRNLVKARVHEWIGGEDLAKTLLDLINTILQEDQEIKNLDACPLDIAHEAPLRVQLSELFSGRQSSNGEYACDSDLTCAHDCMDTNLNRFRGWPSLKATRMFVDQVTNAPPSFLPLPKTKPRDKAMNLLIYMYKG